MGLNEELNTSDNEVRVSSYWSLVRVNSAWVTVIRPEDKTLI